MMHLLPQTGPLPVSPWRWVCVWGTLSWMNQFQQTDWCWRPWRSGCCRLKTPAGWWYLPLRSVEHRLNLQERWMSPSFPGPLWTEQTRAAFGWGGRAPDSQRAGGRFAHTWSWRWSCLHWMWRSGGKRRPGFGPQDELWVHHPACGEKPENEDVWQLRFLICCKNHIISRRFSFPTTHQICLWLHREPINIIKSPLWLEIIKKNSPFLVICLFWSHFNSINSSLKRVLDMCYMVWNLCNSIKWKKHWHITFSSIFCQTCRHRMMTMMASKMAMMATKQPIRILVLLSSTLWVGSSPV